MGNPIMVVAATIMLLLAGCSDADFQRLESMHAAALDQVANAQVALESAEAAAAVLDNDKANEVVASARLAVEAAEIAAERAGAAVAEAKAAHENGGGILQVLIGAALGAIAGGPAGAAVGGARAAARARKE